MQFYERIRHLITLEMILAINSCLMVMDWIWLGGSSKKCLKNIKGRFAAPAKQEKKKGGSP